MKISFKLHPLSRNHFLALLFFVAWGFAIYANSLRGAFQYDDVTFIVDNPVIKDLPRISRIWNAFDSRFLLGLSFALNYAWRGLNPFGFHLVNVIIHIFNAWFVFLFFRLLWRTPALAAHPERQQMEPLAWGVALIFLTHPLQTESVAYIYQRATSLAAFFYLLAVVCYLRFRIEGKMAHGLCAWGAAACGMLTKEFTFTIPFMLFAVEIFFFNEKQRAGREGWGKKLTRLAPFGLLLAVIPLVVFSPPAGTMLNLKGQLAASPVHAFNFLTQINVLRTYLRLLFLPVGQNLDYYYPRVQSFWEAGTAFSLLLVLALAFGGVRLFRARRLLSFFILWFFLSVSVEFVAGAWISNDIFYEHYLYLAVISFAVFLVQGLRKYIAGQRILAAALLSLAVFYSALTVQRNKVWQTPMSLWRDVAKKSPTKIRGVINVGYLYAQEGDQTRQGKFYARSLRIFSQLLKIPNLDDETRAKILLNIAALYGKKGEYGKVIEYGQQALALRPEDAYIYTNLGYAYSLMGEHDLALEHGKKAVALEPDFAQANNNLGVIHKRRGEYALAARFFRRALELDPGYEKASHNLREAEDSIAAGAGLLPGPAGDGGNAREY